MKRTICLLLALLMVLSLLATTALAEDDGAAPAEEPVATETEAPAEPAADPTEEPAPEPAAEPAAEPTEEPVAEPTAEPTEEPVAEPAAEPTAEPVVEPVAAPPADNAVAPASLPDDIQEQPEPTPSYTVVVVHRGDGAFPAPRAEYEKLDVTLTEEGKLPEAKDDWYIPQRVGYVFAGWATSNASHGAVTDDMLQEGDTVAPNADLYPCWKRVIELDAEPGNFQGDPEDDNNYTRTVKLEGNALPSVLPDAPVYDIAAQDGQTVEFTGWYTDKTTMTKIESEEGYWTWKIETHGTPIGPGQDVPMGVITLYAGYTVKEGTPEMHEVTYYLDWNGVNGMWGKCLSSTRAYSEGDKGYKLTAGDLAVRYLNWDGEEDEVLDTQEQLTAYWEKKNADGGFNGYKFLGWATEPGMREPNVVAGTTVIANGSSIYAVWEKFDNADDNSWTFVEEGGRNVEVGPLEYMRFEDLRPYAHAKKNATVTVKLVGFPIGAEIKDVTWTLRFTDGTPLGAFKSVEKEVTESEPFDGHAPNSKGVDMDYGFTATASGGVLTITNIDGMDHGVTVSAVAKSVDGEDNEIDVAVPASATARFSHSWNVEWTKMPTCTEKGEKTWTCTECEEVYEEEVPADGHRFTYYYESPTCTKAGEDKRICVVCGYIEDKILPAAGHKYQVTNVKMQGVMKITTEKCSVCNDVEVIEEDTSIIKGDVTGDKKIDLRDVTTLFRIVSKQSNQDAGPAGDVTKDGAVDLRDVTTLFRYVSHQIDSL